MIETEECGGWVLSRRLLFALAAFIQAQAAFAQSIDGFSSGMTFAAAQNLFANWKEPINKIDGISSDRWQSYHAGNSPIISFCDGLIAAELKRSISNVHEFSAIVLSKSKTLGPPTVSTRQYYNAGEQISSLEFVWGKGSGFSEEAWLVQGAGLGLSI
ncbi:MULTISPECIES: hypothetical protein [unclassified Bosea (in: a-proteobacteria)]|uniref:hypothetical protein n=1 Tax=unclassified Bosea (in: a-proteobacteria) TaxID=2653178 RepID=UPI000F7EB6BE|nr:MULTISPECIES: hypothetical protein [unclassified Bosea (in: a-proteobacteria)]